MKPSLSPEHLENVAKALGLIEEAQQALYAATRYLSPVKGLSPLHAATGKLGDAVKAHWHRLERHPAARTPSNFPIGTTANILGPRSTSRPPSN